MATITTVIPVYNGERYLADTLSSLVAQKRRPDRVVLVDDGSTDQTIPLAQSFRTLDPIIVRNPQNLGLFGNHRRALELAAETDYWHVLHADDTLEPHFLSTLQPPLEGSPTGSFAYGEHEFIDEAGRRDAGATYPLPPGAGYVDRRRVLADQSELRSIQVHAALFKTDRQPFHTQFRTDLPQLGDIVFFAEAASRAGRIWRTSEVVCRVRRHAAAASRANARRLQSWVLDEWVAIRLAAGLIQESAASRAVRVLRLKCLWAARSAVKCRMVGGGDPEYARQIREAVQERVGLPAWLAGSAAVSLREACSRLRGTGR